MYLNGQGQVVHVVLIANHGSPRLDGLTCIDDPAHMLDHLVQFENTMTRRTGSLHRLAMH